MNFSPAPRPDSPRPSPGRAARLMMGAGAVALAVAGVAFVGGRAALADDPVTASGEPAAAPAASPDVPSVVTQPAPERAAKPVAAQGVAAGDRAVEVAEPVPGRRNGPAAPRVADGARPSPATAPAGPTSAPVATPAADPAADAAAREALSRPVSLDLKNAAVPDVLAALSAQAGVAVGASDAAYAALPFGRQTTLPVVEFADRPLAAALDAITQKLGLVRAVAGGRVVLRPSPALDRLGRAATAEELATLDLLASRPLEADGGVDGKVAEGGRTTVRRLLTAVTAALAAADADAEANGRTPLRVQLDVRAADPATDARPISVRRGGSVADALDALARQTKLTWRPDGRAVAVLPKREQVAERLARQVDADFEDEELSQVLVDLSRLAGVPFQIEPGAMQRVPPEFRKVDMTLSASSIAQALESLSGRTGLGYVVTDGGSVYFWNQSSTPASAGRDRPVGFVRLPDGMDLFIYDSDVPDDLRGYYDAKKQELFDAQRRRPTPTARADAPAVEGATER